MVVKQVSVFLENSKGRLFDISKTLADNNININAISIADTTDFGILRIIVSNPIETHKVLKENNFIAELTDVLAIKIDDTPGGMAKAFEVLNNNNVAIEYLYAITKTKGVDAILVLKTEDYITAIESLNKSGISILTKDEFYSL